MKKRIGLLVVFALVAALSFAQFELSAGGGLMFDISLNNEAKGTVGSTDLTYGHTFIAFGGFIFFDATYAEAALSFGPAYGGTYYQMRSPGLDEDVEDIYTTFAMNFSLLGKFPFKLGSSFKLFPLVGFSYNMNFKDFSQLNQLGLLFGAGMDYNFQKWEKLYLRAELLYSIRFPSNFQKDMADLIDGSAKMGMLGAVVKVGVGYKF